MDRQSELVRFMIDYEAGVPSRIHHFLKVLAFCQFIGKAEHLEREQQQILEAAAILHDVGIKESLKKYGSDADKYQQLEGPIVAKELLLKTGYSEKECTRICFLIGHHHIYDNICELDYQILVESDFLVNIFEQGMHTPEILRINQEIFKTVTGKKCLEKMFLTKAEGFYSLDLEEL